MQSKQYSRADIALMYYGGYDQVFVDTLVITVAHNHRMKDVANVNKSL
jgi:hypothetical protein